MKKILFALVALLTIFFSSCSNDEIQISTTLRDYKLTYNISTQGVYDEFGITNSLKEKFLSDNVTIGVYTYIYDQNENLIASDSTYSKTFGQVSQSFDLKEGTYTTVTLEMMVDENLGNSSESWVIVGQDKLSTIEVCQRVDQAYWYSAIGAYTNTVEVTKNGNNINITPKAVGSIINTRVLRFNKTNNYNTILFTTKDQPSGRYFSPKRLDDDRFHYTQYTGQNKWCVREFLYSKTGMKEFEGFDLYLIEEGNVHFSMEPTLSTEENGIIYFGNWTQGYPSDNSFYNFKDGKKYYAGIAYTGGKDGNNCTAQIFDNQNDYNNWIENLEPIYIPDATPYLKWGANASTIENYMLNCGMLFNEDGINTEQGLYWSSYDNPNKTLYYEYRFNTDKTNLQSVLMSYSSEAYSMEDVLKTLRTKYTDYGYDEDLDGYLLGANETTLLVFKNDSGFGVLYVPNTSSNARKMTRSIKNTSFINLLKKVNK